MALTAGDPAPPFALPGVLGGVRREYTLAEFAGRPVVLAFYPGDNTPVCTRQLNAYSSDIGHFLELDAQVLAASPESLDSHQGFAESQGGFAFPLLADLDKTLARDYGVLGPMGFYRRSVFVIDGAGIVTYVHRGHAASTFKRTDELIDAIEAARSHR